MAKATKRKKTERWNLSPKQATALRKLARHPWSIEDGRLIQQTTFGALYNRQFVEIDGNFFRITDAGRKALDLQSHSEIARSASTVAHAGFASIIRELAGYKPPSPQQLLERREPTRAARPHIVARTA